jgi:hypothetical protein
MNTKDYYLALFIRGEFDHVVATSNDVEELRLLRNALNEEKVDANSEYKVEKIQQFYNEAKLIEED